MQKKLVTAWKALRQLGWSQLSQYAIYQVKDKTGWLRRQTPAMQVYPQEHRYLPEGTPPIQFPLVPPTQEQFSRILGDHTDEIGEVVREADHILENRIHFFGGELKQFTFTAYATIRHWSKFTPPTGEDIKHIWEPGRFGWVYPLGRAYILNGNEKYPEKFLELTRDFMQNHPPNCGPHWVSAQEVALRLIAFLFGYRIFSGSGRMGSKDTTMLVDGIIAHARRIPPTLNYARAQNNNHLISEALGLYCAGVALSWHPQSHSWRTLGWHWLVNALQTQIEDDGTYAQHSTNYHRLMLQAALLANAVAKHTDQALLPCLRDKLGKAACWLGAQLDPVSGKVPNLGHNDGAYVFPLATGGFSDYRPVCQASAIAFLGKKLLPPGAYDEMAYWYGLDPETIPETTRYLESPAIHKITSQNNWASIRAVNFHSRPAHADQLHVDLWWKGYNIAIDPGTYSYNLPTPWDNTLMGTDVHNTIYIENLHQMNRSGRFLWLDWSLAEVTEVNSNQIISWLHEYNKLEIQHQRSIQWANKMCFRITDTLISGKANQYPVNMRLQWTLPDYEITRQENKFSVNAPFGKFTLEIEAEAEGKSPASNIYTVLAGKADQDDIKVPAYIGWYSPTYDSKTPCRVIHACFTETLPIKITTTWKFSE